PDIEERLRPLVDRVEEFIPKPFLIKDLVRITKKVVDRLHLEKLQKKASRPGVIQGRLEEMSMIDLMQSLEMGQKSCRLIVQSGGAQGELYFASGQCRDAKIGKLEGDDAVYKVVHWTAGEFEIDFNAANASTKTTTTRNTTGLLMEAMRLMDEANRDTVETAWVSRRNLPDARCSPNDQRLRDKRRARGFVRPRGCCILPWTGLGNCVDAARLRRSRKHPRADARRGGFRPRGRSLD